MTFDMQKARAVCEKATLGPWVAWGGRITHVGNFAGELFNAGLYCRQEDIMFVVGARTLLPAALDRIEEQDKRIAELDAEAQSYHDRKEEFAGRIAELKESLVEERAARHRRRCIESDDDDWCEFPGSDEGCEGCSLPGKIRDEAREQLRREGVIR
ncbi:hypothetical protein M0R72_20335 [Candidatus Pacearchaeota archaeon]|jgi:hypothetical protein|nr:hypothetical protein [Candidatus Pacearchaeota archaeon]